MIIKDGLKLGGKEGSTQIKMSVGLKGVLPKSIRFCREQSESSEDIALVKAINEAKLEKEDILLFDRKLAKTSAFIDFSQRDIKFITKMKINKRYKILESNPIDKQKIDALQMISDDIIQLFHKGKCLTCRCV